MAKALKVLFIDEVPLVGGGGTFLLSLLKQLDTSRVESTVIMPSGPLADKIRDFGVPRIPYEFQRRYESIKVLGVEIPLNPYRLGWRAWDAVRIKRLIRDRGIDVVYTNNLDSHLVGWFLNKFGRMPVVWHIHVSFWPRALYWPPWVTELIFCSEWSRRQALGAARFDPRVHVIPNGINVDDLSGDSSDCAAVRAEFNVPDGVPIFGTTGRLDPVKRIDAIIEAARIWKLSGRPGRWLIVGGEIESRIATSEEARLRELIRINGLDAAVTLTGFRTDIPRLLAAFDVFLFASVEDSNPRSILEAMALGIPVVAVNGGGVPEMLGSTGVLVERSDGAELSNALATLMSKPLELRTRGAASRSRALREYDISAVAAEVERVCRIAATRRR